MVANIILILQVRKLRRQRVSNLLSHTARKAALFFWSSQTWRKLVYSVLPEGELERKAVTSTSQPFSRFQVLSWTPHIPFPWDPYNSPQCSYHCLQCTEKITGDSARPEALHSLCLRAPVLPGKTHSSQVSVCTPDLSLWHAVSSRFLSPPPPSASNCEVWKGGVSFLFLVHIFFFSCSVKPYQ